MTDYSVDERLGRIEAVIQGLRPSHNAYVTQAVGLLRAYAERIEADKGAVPVGYVMDDTATGHKFGLLTQDLPHGAELFTHPPAQAAQVEDEDMDAQLTVMIEHLTSVVESQAAEPVAQAAQLDRARETPRRQKAVETLLEMGWTYNVERGWEAPAPTAAPAAQVDANAALVEAMKLPDGYEVVEHLPGIWGYEYDRDDGERMASSASWNHPALAAIGAWRDHVEALAESAGPVAPAQATQVDPAAKPHTLADFVHAPDAERAQIGQQVAARVDEMMAEPVAQPADSVRVTDRAPIVQQLRGRAAFLRDRGRIKSPEIMERAADALEQLETTERTLERCKEVLDTTSECWRLDVERLEAAQGEAVDCPECGTRCTHRAIPMSDDVIHEYTPIAAQPRAAQNTDAVPATQDDCHVCGCVHDGRCLCTRPHVVPVAQGEVCKICGKDTPHHHLRGTQARYRSIQKEWSEYLEFNLACADAALRKLSAMCPITPPEAACIKAVITGARAMLAALPQPGEQES